MQYRPLRISKLSKDGASLELISRLRVSPSNYENVRTVVVNYPAASGLVEGLALGYMVKAKAFLRSPLSFGQADVKRRSGTS